MSTFDIEHRSRTQRGFTLVELVVAITVVGLCATTLVSLMATISGRSADALVQQHAATIANAYLQEALSKPYTVQAGGGSRANYNDVSDYNFTDIGVHDQLGNAVPEFAGYRVQVRAQQLGIGGVPNNQSYRVVVTVTDPRNRAISVTAYKMGP